MNWKKTAAKLAIEIAIVGGVAVMQYLLNRMEMAKTVAHIESGDHEPRP